jgi:hypothetical protein
LIIAVEDILRAVNIGISAAYKVMLRIEQLMVILSAKMMEEVEREGVRRASGRGWRSYGERTIEKLGHYPKATLN